MYKINCMGAEFTGRQDADLVSFVPRHERNYLDGGLGKDFGFEKTQVGFQRFRVAFVNRNTDQGDGTTFAKVNVFYASVADAIGF